MRESRHIHFALTCANGFNNYDIKTGRVKDLRHVCCGLGQPAKRTACCHRADEYAGVTGKIAHSHAITQHRAARERTGRIDRDDGDTFLFGFTIIQRELIYQRGFAGTRRTGHADQMCFAGMWK